MEERENLDPYQLQILEGIEETIGKHLDHVEEIGMGTLGVKIEGKNIVGLGLFGVNLTEIPDTLFELKSLEELNLACNKINILPEKISQLNFLKELELGLNNLSGLPASIGNLTLLERFSLEQNQLGEIPETMGNLEHLRELVLNENNLQTIPSSFGKLKSLEKLELRSNKINNIPEEIGVIESLKSLILGNNQLTLLPWSIWSLKNLNYLHLDKNPWEGEWNDLVNKDIPTLLEICRKRANVYIFISHTVAEFEKYKIKELADFLEQQEEVYQVFICERDMVGDIKQSMQKNILQSQILLFIATHKSVFESADCKFELDEARRNGVEVIPIKGDDISWEEMKSVGLSSTLGMPFNGEQFDVFKSDLYKYIQQYKREINLFEKGKAAIGRNKFKVRKQFLDFLESEEFSEFNVKNFREIKDLIDKKEEMTMNTFEFFKKLFNLS